MSIRWSCKCGNALEVPDDFEPRVVTCPKCIRSIAVPVPEGELSEEAKRYLKGDNRGGTKKLTKPIKCTYCGWLIWAAEARECPKCLRKIEHPSMVSTIVSFALLTVLVAGGWFGYQKYFSGGFTEELRSQGVRFVSDRAADWRKPSEGDLKWLSGVFPGLAAPGKGIEAEATFTDASYLGNVDGAHRARLTYQITVYQVDPGKPADDPGRREARGVARIEQRLKMDARGRWAADGPPEVVDKKM